MKYVKTEVLTNFWMTQEKQEWKDLIKNQSDI